MTIALASSASRAQCTVPPRARDLLLELHEIRSRLARTSSLIAAPAARSCCPVGQLADDRSALGADGRRGVAEVVPQLRVGERIVRRGREASASPPSCPVGAAPGMPRKVMRASLARISARCTVRVPALSRARPPPMCMRQDESPAAHTLGAGAQHVAHLVGQHRGRDVGVLQRERAAEAAAGLGVGQLDQVETAHLAQQPVAAGRRPAAGAASGRSGGRSPGAGSTRRRRSRRARRPGTRTARRSAPPPRVPARPAQPSPAWSATIGVLVPDGADARAGRRDDGVVARERLDVVAHQRQRLARVAGVDVHLAAAGLVRAGSRPRGRAAAAA